MVLRAPLLLKLAGAGLICRATKSQSPVQKNQPTEKKKTWDRSPALGDRSANLQIFGRFLATVHDDVEAHLRAFCQARVAGPFHRRDMDKHVFAAAVGLNETITLRRVEPLHRSGHHFTSPFE